MYESISRYLIRKKDCVIRDFYRHSELHALSYPEALARRWRYDITL